MIDCFTDLPERRSGSIAPRLPSKAAHAPTAPLAVLYVLFLTLLITGPTPLARNSRA